MTGPLTGVNVIELAGIGPGPYAGQLLADMGASVTVVERPGGGIAGSGLPSVDKRGKASIVADLRTAAGAKIVLDLVKTADILIEGNRPGVTERLGVGPEDCRAINPKLIYGRMTGWGQTGPWAQRAGHDINYIGITGALHAMGKAGEPPAPPLNLVGDYGGGSLFLIAGMLAALHSVKTTGKGEIVDAAIIDGTSSMMGIVYSLHGIGQWKRDREANLLDGSRPFYRCYETADGKYMAVGCIEPKFFAQMLDVLEIEAADFGGQYDLKLSHTQHEKLEDVFAKQTRDHWAEKFDGTDACVTPVLNYVEAASHPQNVARGGLKQNGPFIHPRPAPRFESTDIKDEFQVSAKGSATRETLRGLGYDDALIERLIADKVIAD